MKDLALDQPETQEVELVGIKPIPQNNWWKIGFFGVLLFLTASCKPQIKPSQPVIETDSKRQSQPVPVNTKAEEEKIMQVVGELHEFHKNKDNLTDAEIKEIFALFTPPETQEEKEAYDFYSGAIDGFPRLWRSVTGGALEVLQIYKVIGTEIKENMVLAKVYREGVSRSQTDEPDKKWSETITVILKRQEDKWLIDKCGERKYACFLGIM